MKKEGIGMDRPIAKIREVLKVWFMLRWIERDMQNIRLCAFGELWNEWLYHSIHRILLMELNNYKRQLRQSKTKVVTQKIEGKCIAIEFACQNQWDRVEFPIAFLEAEARAEIRARSNQILLQWKQLLKKVPNQ
ncbi:hypothetical protein LSG31_16940 [Fodinisporobacter ferrooxydans]|uniref:Uncharacterized protein n=1 Tax=Fodinisporobacter ferrooxydans TaxID=2901836 RepID=A0ABY4CJD5_9BACL|nr:hypothetical protein LSG31_16940 [Alicyclobacillaceae bacterium MYW30-H2]